MMIQFLIYKVKEKQKESQYTCVTRVYIHKDGKISMYSGAIFLIFL